MPEVTATPVVLLTGASSGIGYDVAPLLVRLRLLPSTVPPAALKIEELASRA